VFDGRPSAAIAPLPFFVVGELVVSTDPGENMLAGSVGVVRQLLQDGAVEVEFYSPEFAFRAWPEELLLEQAIHGAYPADLLYVGSHSSEETALDPCTHLDPTDPDDDEISFDVVPPRSEAEALDLRQRGVAIFDLGHLPTAAAILPLPLPN
jgi:hypothetical protein